jgi:hypothetical protein
MIHIFPWFHSHLRAGRTAIEEAGKWIADVTVRQPHTATTGATQVIETGS